MADAKPRNGRRLALGFAALVLVWLGGVWPPPVWWRDHWPRQTAVMRLRSDGRTVRQSDGSSVSDRPTVRPSALRDISPLLQRMVILAEDSRFRTHYGLDFAEVADALGLERGAGFGRTVVSLWRRRDRLRGASTITQQLAKNLYLSPSRNPFRKIKEAVTALHLELTLPKDRILELYLNVAEWGPVLWGAAAASRAYFDVPPSRLDEWQAAALAATLPHPRSSNPTYRPARMRARQNLILARYHGADVTIPPEEDVDLDSLPGVVPITPLVIPPVSDTLMDSIRTQMDTAQGTTTRRRAAVNRETVAGKSFS